MSDKTSIHGQWSNRVVFILAATGSAVGLGNIWKFPYEVGDNGGAAFILVYLFFTIVIGFPIMLSGYLGRLLMVADRSIIALYLDKESLGVYALSVFLIMAMIQVPRSFSLIFFPILRSLLPKFHQFS